jgi:hypothetical protein
VWNVRARKPWSFWAYMNQLPHATARGRALAVATLGLCILPDLPVGAAGYRDRLMALTPTNQRSPA